MTERGLGPCDLLTLEQACRVLRMSDAAGRTFLEARGLVRHFAGRPRIVAGELVRAYDEAEVDKPALARPRAPMRRAQLR